MRQFNKQRGFLHNLVIPALMMMGIVLAGWGYMMNQNQVGQNVGRSVDNARTQLEKIQNVLNWCRVMYPNGNNGLGGSQPSMPGSPVDGSWVPARDITCPGAPAITVWLAAHDQLSMPGQFLGEWEYRYVPTGVGAGVFLRVSTAVASDVNGRAVLTQVASRLHASQKNLSGDTLVITISQ